MNKTIQRYMKTLLYMILPLVVGGMVGVSCSEGSDTEDEYANWQERNEVFFASLTDSLSNAPAVWFRIKNFALDSQTEGLSTDYIYVKVIESGEETERPTYTDSVRCCYQGRVIPTASYPKGYVFDGSVYGTYSIKTNATSKMKLSNLILGMQTALLHMHRGDYWRVYIPSTLGYGSQDMTSSGIPPYSMLIFDLTLVDFSPVGQTMPVWRSREANLQD